MIDALASSTQPYRNQTLYDRNRFMLLHRAPGLGVFLDAGPSGYTVTKTDTGYVYLARSGRPVLDGPDPDYSRERMDAFLARPLKSRRRMPLHAVSVDPEYWRDVLDDFMPGLDPDISSRIPTDPAAVNAVVMIDQTSSDALVRALETFHQASVFVLVVTDADLFKAAMHVMDWTAVIRRCDELGIDLRLIPAPQGASDASSVITTLAGYVLIKPDLVLQYRHTDGRIAQEFFEKFEYDLLPQFIGLGFFRDEVAMYTATYDNLIVKKRPLLNKQPQHDGTVLVVGSGRSLDDRIEIVRDMSETCLVVGCGTATEALLSHGIRVDIGVTIERGWHITKVYESAKERVDLSGVTMIASSVTHPDALDLFDKSYLVMREGLNPSRGFAHLDHHMVRGLEPSVTNMGVGVSLFLGFRRLFLFGVDFGSFSEQTHSSGTIYYKNDTEFKLKSDFNEHVRATFGRGCWSNFFFSYCHNHMELQVNRLSNALYINGSDGRAIKGTAPLTKEALKYARQIFPVGESGRDIELDGEFFDEKNLRYNPEMLHGYVRRLQAVFDNFSWDRRRDVLASLHVILYSPDRRNPFPKFFNGSVALMVFSLLQLLDRMTEQERAQFEPGMRRLLRSAVDNMRAEALDLVVHGTRRFSPDDPRLR